MSAADEPKPEPYVDPNLYANTDADALPKLGSLAQSEREKHLKTARTVFVIVGLLTIAVNVFSAFSAESMMDHELDKEFKKQGINRADIDPEMLREIRDTAIRTTIVFSWGLVAIGVIYLLFAVFVSKFPVPITIAGLVIYLACAALMGYLDPTSLAQGIIMKVIIIVALVKAMKAAIAYQSEEDAALQYA